MSDQANDLLQKGIAAARAGQRADARQLLREAIKLDPRNEIAWLWLSSVVDESRERLFCLRQVLAINPQNEHAIRGMQKYGADSKPKTASQEMQANSTIPYPDSTQLSETLSELDAVLARHQSLPFAALPFAWAKKNRGRVGDAAAARLRAILFVAGAAVLAGIIGLIGFVYSYIANPNYAVINVTLLPSPTITPTWTRTPGVAPTSSPVPEQTQRPSATPDFPGGRIGTMTVTPVFPDVGDTSVARDAQNLFILGKYTEALEKFEDERKGSELQRDDRYFQIVYYMALSELALNRPGRALSLLENNRKDDSAFIRAAFAATYFAQERYDDAFTEAQAAIRVNPKVVLGPIIAARVYAQRAEFANARRELDDALRTQERNVWLLVERSAINLRDNKADDALSDALLALYIDPTNRDGFIARSRALMGVAAGEPTTDQRVQRYGQAVLATQEFLFYYPGETLGWLLLGQAREGEGNITAALDAYAQAIVADTESDAARDVLIARGQLLLKQRRYQDAVSAFEQADSIRSNSESRALRLEALLGSGDYVTALREIDGLLEQNPDDVPLRLRKFDLLIRARVVDRIPRELFAAEAATITDDFIATLTPEQAALARAVRGIAQFESGSLPEALSELNASLSVVDTAVVHYFRGQVLEGQGLLEQALADYQWVLVWSNLYELPFAGNAQERIERVRAVLPTDTATPTMTFTPTVTPSLTPTRTFTPSRTPVPTRTPRPSRTPVPTRTPRPSVTPRVTATPAD